jgi:Zn finger protein HypA/HybF involved in hydrogenase expression
VPFRDPEEGKRSKKRYYNRNRCQIRRLQNTSRQQKIHDARVFFGGKCQKCGWAAQIDCLQFDHVRALFAPRVRKTSERAYNAIENKNKLQLLCPNCHAVKTHHEKASNPLSKYARRRVSAIRLMGGACEDCPCSDPRYLIFHRRVPIKMTYSSSFRTINEVIKAPELFQLLCANCHAIKLSRRTGDEKSERSQ